MPNQRPPDIRPRLVVADAARAIDYYRRVFGAVEIERHPGPAGGIVHAELAIGDACLTLKDQDATDRAPSPGGGSAVLLMLDVEDVDAVGERMVAAGGTVVFPIGDSEHGRGGRIADPFGHVWMLSQRTDPGPDLGALSDLCTPWCIRVAATLRIADLIAAGTTDIDGLAAAARCDPYALHRVLTYLVGRGVFEEISPARFALNGAARGLLDPSMRRFDLDIEGIGGRFAYAWGTLLAYVRTGAPAYREVFGLPYWEDLAAHPDIGASFDALMGPEGHGTPDPSLDLADGWGWVRTVVDVGGGTGAMLAEILRTRPQIHGTLVDLPGTVERSREIFRVAGVADRVETVGQSCFDPLPAGSDLYLLRGVLNDWPDPEATAILRRCAEAARPRGRVVVMKGVGPDDSPRPLTIEMVLLGGKHRTVSEFRGLADDAGLDVVAAERQASGSFVVECRPR